MKDLHDRVVQSRLKCLNNILPIFNQQATDFTEVLAITRFNIDNIDFILLSVEQANKYITNEILRIKKEISIISRCNNIYLQTQLIVSDDDARRYVDFMTMSYSGVAKDIVKLWQRLIFETTKIQNQTTLITLLYQSYKSSKSYS